MRLWRSGAVSGVGELVLRKVTGIKAERSAATAMAKNYVVD
jgi:hypothetical protein